MSDIRQQLLSRSHDLEGALCSLYEKKDCTDAGIAAGLQGNRIDPSQKKPSSEAVEVTRTHLGAGINLLTLANVHRIFSRPDEHERRRFPSL